MKKYLICFLVTFVFILTAEDKILDKYLPNKGVGVVKHFYYDVKYDDFTKCPDYVVYRMGEQNRKHTANRLSKRFVKDPSILSCVFPNSYAKTGYDTGHMCPANDMSFSDTAMQETFYMSNVCPQLAKLNRGAWKELENRVRKLNYEGRELIIIVGPVFIAGYAHETISKENIFVPQYFFKIVYDVKNNEMLGFLFPEDSIANKDIEEFIVEVDKIEKLKKVNFFKGIKNEVKLEKGLSGFGISKMMSKDNQSHWSFD